jgi:hypothetical protein
VSRRAAKIERQFVSRVLLDVMTTPRITFGDEVRICATPATEALGIAGRIGIVYGATTPSVTDVSVVGESCDDYAVSVRIEGQDEQFWVAPALLEFVSHAAGTVKIGTRQFMRAEGGEWQEVKPS